MTCTMIRECSPKPVSIAIATNDQMGDDDRYCPPTPVPTMAERSEPWMITDIQKPYKAKTVMRDSSKRIRATEIVTRELVVFIHGGRGYLASLSQSGRRETF